ncbi:MAG TPA: S41 family peptidase, partial [Thermoanaerobaculia bacterium]|nr:S41 family peptidase [Thermoanaerobaculia bacterium]
MHLRSRFLAAAAALLLALPTLHAQTALPPPPPTAPQNLDFEQGTPGSPPPGWHSPAANGAYTVKIATDAAKSGKRCVVVESQRAPAPREFGNVMQVLDATPYRGKRLRYRAAVRTDIPQDGGYAGLWLRVDRPEHRIGFFDNMQGRPITEKDWRVYEIVADIDEDAERINFGMMLIGEGKAWLDDVSLADLGKPLVRAAPPRALTPRGLENLVALARMIGYVRHFHPSDEAAKMDWNRFTVEAIGWVEPARNDDDLARLLRDAFALVAPTARVLTRGERAPPVAVPKDLAGLQIVSWVHHGFGQDGATPVYKSVRMVRPAAGFDLDKEPVSPIHPYAAELGGVSSLIPIALFQDARGTLPHRDTPPPPEPLPVRYSGNDRATRLTAVILAWNVFEHFYPYFDAVKADWPGELRKALTSAATDPDDAAFAITLRRMTAALQDGHAHIEMPGGTGSYSLPLVLTWVEGQIVVTAVATPLADAGVLPGEVVVKIDGKPASDVVASMESLVSAATPQWRRHIALIELCHGPKDSEITLDLKDPAGDVKSVTLPRTETFQTAVREKRPRAVEEIRPGIQYVDLTRVTDDELQHAVPALAEAKGIVFDLRGYPNVRPDFLTHLSDKHLLSAQWRVPVITMPDGRAPRTYEGEHERWDLPPSTPRFGGKIAFLTDGSAISYAESIMGIVEAYKLGEIVGEPTAGTNGDINRIRLPGGY